VTLRTPGDGRHSPDGAGRHLANSLEGDLPRYSDPWPGAERPDPDDLDAACDLLLRGARYDDADERTTLYLFLPLRDRQHLMACPNDARALMTRGERLMAFPDAGASASPACTAFSSWNSSAAPTSRPARGPLGRPARPVSGHPHLAHA
jgi:hypothetical protein